MSAILDSKTIGEERLAEQAREQAQYTQELLKHGYSYDLGSYLEGWSLVQNNLPDSFDLMLIHGIDLLAFLPELPASLKKLLHKKKICFFDSDTFNSSYVANGRKDILLVFEMNPACMSLLREVLNEGAITVMFTSHNNVLSAASYSYETRTIRIARYDNCSLLEMRAIQSFIYELCNAANHGLQQKFQVLSQNDFLDKYPNAEKWAIEVEEQEDLTCERCNSIMDVDLGFRYPFWYQPVPKIPVRNWLLGYRTLQCHGQTHFEVYLIMYYNVAISILNLKAVNIRSNIESNKDLSKNAPLERELSSIEQQKAVMEKKRAEIIAQGEQALARLKQGLPVEPSPVVVTRDSNLQQSNNNPLIFSSQQRIVSASVKSSSAITSTSRAHLAATSSSQASTCVQRIEEEIKTGEETLRMINLPRIVKAKEKLPSVIQFQHQAKKTSYVASKTSMTTSDNKQPVSSSGSRVGVSKLIDKFGGGVKGPRRLPHH